MGHCTILKKKVTEGYLKSKEGFLKSTKTENQCYTVLGHLALIVTMIAISCSRSLSPITLEIPPI